MAGPGRGNAASPRPDKDADQPMAAAGAGDAVDEIEAHPSDAALADAIAKQDDLFSALREYPLGAEDEPAVFFQP